MAPTHHHDGGTNGRAPMHVRGVVLPDDEERDVFIVDGRFTFEPHTGGETARDAGYLLPGLVDVHNHLSLASPAGDDATAEERVRASAAEELRRGVLAIREPGSPDRASSALGPGEGYPRVFTAGRFLAPPGGYFPGLAREVPEGELCAAAAEELAQSGGWVKLIGDYLGPDGRFRANWRPETLAEVARTVHVSGGRVAIHAMIGEVVDAAVRAGFDSIEHGIGADEDAIDRMLAGSIAWVPTLFPGGAAAFEGFARSLGMPDDEVRRMSEHVDRWPSVIAAAAESGVRVLAGTDAGQGPHGMIAHQVRLLIEAGVDPERALAGASWDARSFLGLPGIEEGAPADLVVFSEDPRVDPGVLEHPDLIVLDGRPVGGDR